MRHVGRRTVIATVGTGCLAGCLAQLRPRNESASSERTDDRSEQEDDAGLTGPREAPDTLGADMVPDSSGVVPTSTRDLPLPADLGRLNNAMMRGALQDGIPSIDHPSFVDADVADGMINPDDPVFGVIRNGEIKAYAQYILVWHEIVNDRFGDQSVAITYCPLTGTAQGFVRGEAEFGVSGMLLNSNLVMYDRPTDSYWPQMLAHAIKGEHEGDELAEFDVVWTTWDRWRSTYPETEFLSEETGYVRDYGRDPYGSYDPPGGHYTSENLMFPQFGSGLDLDYHPKRVFFGVRTADGALAVGKDTLAEERLVETTVGDTPYVMVYDAILDTGWCYRNPQEATVSVEDDAVTVDGTTYDPAMLPLDPVVRYDAMWFAWEGYYPETEVVA